MSALPQLKDPFPAVDFQDQDFPYGWRQVSQTLPDGQVIYQDIPLTLEDFLDPQVEDQMPQNSLHLSDSFNLFHIFQTRYQQEPTIGVFSDLKMDWGIPGLQGPAPDVAVVPHLNRDKHLVRSTFDVLAEGTRPSLVIEIVSPRYSGDETEKVKIYQRAGVEEYFIIHPHSDAPQPYYEITGYRRSWKGYQRLQPDSQGYWYSQATQVWLSVSADRRRLLVMDAQTGEVLLNPQETQQALDETQQVLDETQQALDDTKAAQQEAEARAQQAEARAQAEAEARAALERRLQELEAKLKNL